MRLLRILPLPAMVLLTVAPLASQLIPRGPEFRVNEADLKTMKAPILALDAAGTLLAVWPGQGATQDALVARTFNHVGVPLGTERAFSTPGYQLLDPDVTALGTGRFVLAWDRTLGGDGTIAARVLGTDGAPLGPELRLDLDSHAVGGGRPQVDALPSGGFLATWNGDVDGLIGLEAKIVARPFDENGAPAAAETPVTADWAFNWSLVVLQDGGFLSFWGQPGLTYPYPPPYAPSLRSRRFDAAGQPVAEAVALHSEQVAVSPDGRFAVASTGRPLPPLDLQRTDTEVYVTFYDREGRSLNSEATVVAGGPGNQVVEAVAMDDAGRFLVLWTNSLGSEDPYVDSDVFARLYSAAGQPLGPSFPVAAGPGDQFGASVVEKNGEWVISWVSEPANTYWGGELYARRFSTCVTDGSTLCLANRFRAEVAFQSGPGGNGSGQAVPLTGDTGAFWFFDPANVELVVKAIDGNALNDHFWIFYGALSNVQYDLTVTDTVTGVQKVYHNPAGTMASRADTRAFQEPGPPPPAAAASFLQEPQSMALPEEVICPPGTGVPCCPPVPWLPCLHGGRFSVDVTWRTAAGQTGSGQVVELSSDSVYVWFFDQDNVELVIKILDGRGLNGKFWVFYGALSDVEYTIRVTDNLTGKVKTYHNPAGTMASRADTSAF